MDGQGRGKSEPTTVRYIEDTQYGHLVALQEQELLAMLDGMTQEKKDAIRKKLDEMSMDSTELGESIIEYRCLKGLNIGLMFI